MGRDKGVGMGIEMTSDFAMVVLGYMYVTFSTQSRKCMYVRMHVRTYNVRPSLEPQVLATATATRRSYVIQLW